MKKQARQMIVLAVVFMILGISYLALRGYQEKLADQAAVDERVALKQLSEEDIIRISYYYEDENYTFEKRDDKWYSTSDPDLSLKQYPFSTMVSYLSELRVEDSVGKVTDMAPYGLDEPQMTVKFETGQESCTVLIGDYNSMAEGYYICLEGEDTVHLVASAFKTVFSYDLERLADDVSGSDS